MVFRLNGCLVMALVDSYISTYEFCCVLDVEFRCVRCVSHSHSLLELRPASPAGAVVLVRLHQLPNYQAIYGFNIYH